MVAVLGNNEAGVAEVVAILRLLCNCADGDFCLIWGSEKLEKVCVDWWLTLPVLRLPDAFVPAGISSLGIAAAVIESWVRPASSIAFLTALPNSSSANSLRPLSAI